MELDGVSQWVEAPVVDFVHRCLSSFILERFRKHTEGSGMRSSARAQEWSRRFLGIVADQQRSPSVVEVRSMRPTQARLLRCFREPPPLLRTALKAFGLLYTLEGDRLVSTHLHTKAACKLMLEALRRSDRPREVQFAAFSAVFVASAEFCDAAMAGLETVLPHLSRTAPAQRAKGVAVTRRVCARVERARQHVLARASRGVEELRAAGTPDGHYLNFCNAIQAAVAVVERAADAFAQIAP